MTPRIRSRIVRNVRTKRHRRPAFGTRRLRAGAKRAQPAIAAILALAMAHGVAAQTGTGTDTPRRAAGQPEMAPGTQLGNTRHVCAHYDAERAAYTGTMALLEPAGGAGPTTAEGTAYRLVVLAMHEDSPEAAQQASTLIGDRALALLENARAAHRDGRAAREVYRGHLAREPNRVRFTGGDVRTMSKTMMVFTTAGVAIVESSARGRGGMRSDGAYRCAPPMAPDATALLPGHCAEARVGGVDLGSFPVPGTEVRLIQRALEEAGMQPGPIDGILGPRTLAALVRWNERAGHSLGRIVTYESVCPLIDALPEGTLP